jgi:hypothetical protein
MTEFLNWDNPSKLKDQIENIQPISGICIFIDIVGSTKLKNENLKEWIIKIGNSLNIALGASRVFADNVIKYIGDEVMIFIPIEKLGIENFFTIFDFLKTNMTKFNSILDNDVLEFKSAIHYCKDVYNISYQKDTEDYYGIDIDLTARLMKESSPNSIVTSEEYYSELTKFPSFTDSFKDFFCSGCTKEMKGIQHMVKYRIFNVTAYQKKNNF